MQDGGHDRHLRNAVFAHKPLRGVYLVEDAYTCYRPQHGGGLKREGTFMEFTKDKIDELNAPTNMKRLTVTEFSRSTDFIACYDDVVVYERRPQGHRQTLITTAMSAKQTAQAAEDSED